MVVFTSSRASWLLSLAVLGLACTGVREDPTPGDAPAPIDVGSINGSGAGGGGGGVTFGGGVPQGGGSSGSGAVFADCVCAGIAESLSVTACNTCAETANMPDTPCGDQRLTCEADTTGCGLALQLLDGNDCGGDPECTADLLTGILNDDTAPVLFGYFSCLCGLCATCVDAGAGGGGVGGGAPADGSCKVGLQ